MATSSANPWNLSQAISNHHQPQKRKSYYYDNSMEDWISELPDEILLTILSPLTLKEAARTCVLSHRWENLWKYFNGSFDFEPPKAVVHGLIAGSKSVEIERCRYTGWVKQVLSLHRGTTTDMFRVSFDLDSRFGHVIDSWIRFALLRGVRRLELDLLTSMGRPHFEYSYTFPMWPLDFSSFNNLSALHLMSVNVTDEVLAHCLSNCALLEELCVVGSTSLVNVKVAGPSLKLKYLEISHCFGIKNVEISATNLVSFTYFGPKLSMPFKDVPCLAEASIGGDYCEFLVFECWISIFFCEPEMRILDSEFHQLSLRVPWLETLKLDLHPLILGSDLSFAKEFPQLSNLRYLELQVQAHDDQSLLLLTPLIEACPCLHKFAIKLAFLGPVYQVQLDGEPFVQNQARKATVCPYQCLKVVEFSGFAGHRADLELAMYLLGKAVWLEKISIDPHDPRHVGRFEFVETKGMDVARERAKLLAAKLPPGAELVVL